MLLLLNKMKLYFFKTIKLYIGKLLKSLKESFIARVRIIARSFFLVFIEVDLLSSLVEFYELLLELLNSDGIILAYYINNGMYVISVVVIVYTLYILRDKKQYRIYLKWYSAFYILELGIISGLMGYSSDATLLTAAIVCY